MSHQAPGSGAARQRARDLGIPFDGVPGPINAITDVGGVEVSRDGGATWRATGVAEGRGLALSTDSTGAPGT